MIRDDHGEAAENGISAIIGDHAKFCGKNPRSPLKGTLLMTQLDAQDARISEIVGDIDEAAFDDCRDKYYRHLESSLQLPCDVTGIEDFRWEEYYVIGPGDRKEHERLRKNQPSYKDIFELLAIEKSVFSEWMLCYGEDLAGHVRRKSDGKEFYLGLSEIEPVDEKSKNYQLLNDYAVWFVNYR